jgi:hypothetical protein
MEQIILAQGVFPLTQEAADAALDVIDFIAAAVRGYDAIDVTSVVRPIWREHLAYYYPHLSPVTQHWYATAPQKLASIRAEWPFLDPFRRGALLQQWAMELPQMLWMVDPVLARAQAIEMQQAQRSRIEQWRSLASTGQPAQTPAQTPAQLVKAVNTSAQISDSLARHNVKMTDLTIDWMRAMNRRG